VSIDSQIRWLSIPELAEILGIAESRVRRLIEDRTLLASKIDNSWKVPEVFIRENEPLAELRGTLIVLKDCGYSDDEAMNWLLSSEDSIGISPVNALRAGRKAEVRRVAQALGF